MDSIQSTLRYCVILHNFFARACVKTAIMNIISVLALNCRSDCRLCAMVIFYI